MIPVSLSLKGLYSYQDEQIIEFDRLIEGQLFGIFGSVGSGKSSILEAISFALYGQTERLDNRDNRNYNMMNLKSNELLIDFTFRNFDGELYRYTVKGKRNGKDFEKVNTFERAAYHWFGEAWSPMESTIAESVIGLSYDNFRRTIIIPQGKFQEFLQLGHSQRTQMLKEIFQLEKYEFFYQTKNLEAKNNSALQHLNGQLSTYAEIEKEKIIEKKGYVLKLGVQLEGEKKALESKSAQFDALSKLKALMENLRLQQELLNNLQNDEDSFIMLGRKINDYEYCIQHFRNGLDRVNEKQESIREKKASLTELNKLRENVKTELQSLSIPLEKSTAAFLQQDADKEKLQDFHQLISLVRLRTTIDKHRKRIEKGEQVVADVLLKKQEAEEKRNAFKKDLQEKNALMPDMSVLVALRTWFDHKSNLTAALQTTQLEMEHLKAEEKVLHDKFYTSLAAIKNLDSPEKLTVETAGTHLVAHKRDKDHAIEQLNAQVEHFKVQIKLSEFTEALKRGEACPLCGSLSHEFVLEVEDVQLRLQAIEAELQGIKAEHSILLQTENEVQVYQNNLDFIRNKIDQTEGLAENNAAAITLHLQAFKWPNADPNQPNKVSEQLQQAITLRTTIQEIEGNLEHTDQALEHILKEYDRYVESLNQIKTELNTSIAESNTLVKQLKQHDAGDVLRYEEAILTTLFQELKDKIAKDKEIYESLNAQLSSLKEQELKASLQIEGLQSAKTKEEESLQRIQEELAVRLGNSTFTDWQQVNAILTEEFLIDEAKDKLTRYNLQVYSAKDRFIELSNQAAGQSFDPTQYEDLLLEVSTIQNNIAVLHEEYIGEKSLYEAWLVQLAAKLKLQAEIEKLVHRSENIKIMRQMFMGNGFVNYISTVYLQNLCQVANERFYQLTHQQLRLELGDKNEFLVRDFMNDGKVRSVKTLSGGQTFQASLCLALALAESVQQQNKSKQNFFFLDEGFGSLDKESLQMAFETLKSLRKENRIVGIISHVEDLQQEIDVYLKVVNDSFSGSKVVKSWLV